MRHAQKLHLAKVKNLDLETNKIRQTPRHTECGHRLRVGSLGAETLNSFHELYQTHPESCCAHCVTKYKETLVELVADRKA